MKNCPNCSSPAITKTLEPLRFMVRFGEGELTVEVDAVPGMKCEHCGFVVNDAPTLTRAELAGALALARNGVRGGGPARFIRKALGFRANQLADLLDVTPETVSRWENDRSPIDRSAWVTLCGLAADRLNERTTTMDHLRAAAAEPKIENDKVETSLGSVLPKLEALQVPPVRISWSTFAHSLLLKEARESLGVFAALVRTEFVSLGERETTARLLAHTDDSCEGSLVSVEIAARTLRKGHD